MGVKGVYGEKNNGGQGGVRKRYINEKAKKDYQCKRDAICNERYTIGIAVILNIYVL